MEAAEAERWGLVNQVVEPQDLMPAALARARQIAANAPLAVQAAKELAIRSLDVDLATGLRLEQFATRALMATNDWRKAARPSPKNVRRASRAPEYSAAGARASRHRR